MADLEITISAKESEWRALLAALPRCVHCGVLAAVTLDRSPMCCGCAGRYRRGNCETLAHTYIAERIDDACAPQLLGGKS